MRGIYGAFRSIIQFGDSGLWSSPGIRIRECMKDLSVITARHAKFESDYR